MKMMQIILLTIFIGSIFWISFILGVAFSEDGKIFYSWIFFIISFFILPMILIFRIRINKILKKFLLFIRKNYKKISIFIFLVISIILFYNIINYHRINNMCIVAVSWRDEDFFDKLNGGYEKILYLDDDFYLNHCDADNYDCSDFCSKEDAKKLFDECYNLGGVGKNPIRDINNLDKDNDGIPCESFR